MAKNVEEKKALLDVLTKSVEKNKARWTSNMSTVPVREGQVLTFSGEIKEQVSTTAGVPNWDAFTTVEGFPIALGQIARRNNGLIFPQDCVTSDKALEAFISKCCEYDNGLSLTIKEVVKIESSSRKGKNTYYIFEEFTI